MYYDGTGNRRNRVILIRRAQFHMSSGYLWVLYMYMYNCESERWVDVTEGIVKKYPDKGI